MATTSGNSEPLSHVDDDGTECPPRLPGHRAAGGMGGGPTAAGPQPGTAKIVSLSADPLPVETAKPPVSGELVTLERHAGAESRPASRPGEPPDPRQTEAPAGKGGGLRVGSQGPRAQARPPPASGAMPCLRGA